MPLPPPCRVEEQTGCFVLRDANGHQLGYFYFEDEPGRRAQRPSTSPAMKHGGLRPILLSCRRSRSRSRFVPADSSLIAGALTDLVNGRIELKDVSPDTNPVDLIQLAKNLTDIAVELQRKCSARALD
jgi:hypothetical protein